jgi:hypothetical protein
MKEPNDNLERLVSRYLDQECTDEERRELQAMLRRDADAASFFDEYADLERETNFALKRALGRAPVRRRVAPSWIRMRRTAALGLAAAVAAFVWYSPSLRPDLHGTSGKHGPKTRSASWFAPPPAAGDVLVDESARYERPEVRLDKDERNWIVVPGENPGEYMVVEVKRVRTRTIPLQSDF